RSQLGDDLETVTVPVTTLSTEFSELPEEAAVCVKIDVEGAELDVLEGALALLRERPYWLIMLEVLHMEAFGIYRLSHRYRAGLLDKRGCRIVGVPRTTEEPMRNWVDASWLYRQDLVLMSDAVAQERISGLEA
ncbi:MAG: FkbM family methyltransferase, partial [Cumulibacter sp.]